MTPEDHFRHFAEFVRAVELTGGTTPHVAMTVESMSRLTDDVDKLWFAGCYALTYNWPAAERLFLEVRPEDAAGMLPWLEEHWAGLPLRKERKAVFRKPFFVESAATYADYAFILASADSWPGTYNAAFASFVRSCKYMGRYIAIRWLEVMRRAFPRDCAGWVMPDILSDGGQHPRKALALMYPAHAEALLGGNSPAELTVSDRLSSTLMVDLELTYGVKTDFYELQSLLCEYKQSALGRKQYPGKSIDTEMDHWNRTYAHWGGVKQNESQFFAIRATCFPEWALGETDGRWWGVRPELGGVLADFGYTWSDFVYNYQKTEDFSTPVMNVSLNASLL
jgi:hypothetical protein